MYQSIDRAMDSHARHHPTTNTQHNQPPQQILVMQGVDDKAIFRIKGKYPTKGVKYFSLQSNNVALGTAVRTIVDHEITPDAGRYV